MLSPIFCFYCCGKQWHALATSLEQSYKSHANTQIQKLANTQLCQAAVAKVTSVDL